MNMEAEEILAALDRNKKERDRLHEELEKLTTCYRCVHRELCNFALKILAIMQKCALRDIQFVTSMKSDERSE